MHGRLCAVQIDSRSVGHARFTGQDRSVWFPLAKRTAPIGCTLYICCPPHCCSRRDERDGLAPIQLAWPVVVYESAGEEPLGGAFHASSGSLAPFLGALRPAKSATLGYHQRLQHAQDTQDAPRCLQRNALLGHAGCSLGGAPLKSLHGQAKGRLLGQSFSAMALCLALQQFLTSSSAHLFIPSIPVRTLIALPRVRVSERLFFGYPAKSSTDFLSSSSSSSASSSSPSFDTPYFRHPSPYLHL